MDDATAGIHHVTCFCGKDTQRHERFYSEILGMRRVKLTVNFENPKQRHFYWGDDVGRPGSLLTFFPHNRNTPGEPGAGQVTAVALVVPGGSLHWWQARLAAEGVTSEEVGLMGEQHLRFEDPDGLCLELVTASVASRPFFQAGPVPSAYAIRGLHSVVLCERALEPTAEVLTDHLGFQQSAREGNRVRFTVWGGEAEQIVDVVLDPDAPVGKVATGSVHHVAFRTEDEVTQLASRSSLRRARRDPTDVRDRKYFKSVYFTEPGGVLFEVATDGPGFLIDEGLGELGDTLQLPQWLESRRAELT